MGGADVRRSTSFLPFAAIAGLKGGVGWSSGHSGLRCGSGDRGWVVGQGSAGSVLRSQGSSREYGLSRCARGMRVIASNARSGPIPLPPVRAWWLAICRSFFGLTPGFQLLRIG